MRRATLTNLRGRSDRTGRRRGRLVRVCASVVAALFHVGPAMADARCADNGPLYVPLETVRERLDLRGETRAGYLDRRYGAGRWRIGGDDGPIRIAPPQDDGPLTLRASAQADIERIDLIVEARLDVLTRHDRRIQAYGHRDLASYALASDAQSTIEVPTSVFQEPGALVIVLHHRSPVEGRALAVFEWSQDQRRCEARIYTEDRFTAIRLNRRSRR